MMEVQLCARREQQPSRSTMKEVLLLPSRMRPSSTIVDHHRPSSPIVAHRRPSSTIVAHRQPSSTIVAHRRPSSPIINHRQPSLTIVAHRRPSSPIVDHRRPPSNTVEWHPTYSETKREFIGKIELPRSRKSSAWQNYFLSRTVLLPVWSAHQKHQ